MLSCIPSIIFLHPQKSDNITLLLDENTYLVMVLRYKELSTGSGGGGGRIDDVPFEISGHLTEIDTGKIDADYMNSRFEKYLKTFEQNDANHADMQKILDELHKSFASLTQEEQKFANIFLHDVQRGDVKPEKGKTFREYVTEYIANAKNEQIIELVNALGSSDGTNITAFNIRLTRIMNAGVTVANMNEFGRFDELKSFVDKDKAKAYFEHLEGVSLSPFKINMKIDALLQEFILSGGFDLEKPSGV
jgi:type I restriction enzyme R subunit